jgi:hypothetical protein
MQISAQTRAQAQDLLDFIDASPGPWHAVETTAASLLAEGSVTAPGWIPPHASYSCAKKPGCLTSNTCTTPIWAAAAP